MKIFVSYTTKDNEITIDRLKTIAYKLKYIGHIYVDLIDNDSLNKQKRVLYELDNSDMVILILSNEIFNSNWVKIEIERAKNNNIPIIKLTVNEIFSLTINELANKINTIFPIEKRGYRVNDIIKSEIF